jgi:hypothetical protein
MAAKLQWARGHHRPCRYFRTKRVSIFEWQKGNAYFASLIKNRWSGDGLAWAKVGPPILLSRWSYGIICDE